MMEPAVIGGVKAFILTPKELAPANRNRLLVHVHGGGYVARDHRGVLGLLQGLAAVSRPRLEGV